MNAIPEHRTSGAAERSGVRQFLAEHRQRAFAVVLQALFHLQALCMLRSQFGNVKNFRATALLARGRFPVVPERRAMSLCRFFQAFDRPVKV